MIPIDAVAGLIFPTAPVPNSTSLTRHSPLCILQAALAMCNEINYKTGDNKPWLIEAIEDVLSADQSDLTPANKCPRCLAAGIIRG